MTSSASAERRLEAERDVAREHVAADRNRRRVDRAAQRIDGDVGRPAADIEQHDADLLLFLQQRRGRARERLEDDAQRLQAGALDALEHVGDEARAAGDDVRVDFQASAGHADRIADAFLAVDREVARQRVDDLTVAGQVDDLARVDHAPNVAGGDLAVVARDGDDGAIVRAADVVAGDPDEDLAEVDARPCARPFRSRLRST